MEQRFDPGSCQDIHFFPDKPALRMFIIGIIFLTAFVIRLHHINVPPLEFQPTRQYMMAHNTRVYYYDALDSISEQKKELASINKKRMGFPIELPVLDHAAAFGYRIIGGEHIWLPRVLSIVFWMIGGIFLYLIALKLYSSGAALFSTVFYLFLPFGISASRSFQPDPLMLMLLLISLFMILNYYERPSLSRVAAAAAVSALAMIIKPYCVFLIFGAFISLAFYKQGFRKSLTDRYFYLFILLSPLPGAAYYISGMLSQGDFLQEQASASFLPHLLAQPYFWKNWLAMVLRVLGLISFGGAILGLFIIRSGFQKVFLTGLWAGYIIFGLLFTFHIHTHDYYQLQFIPVVALSLGPLGALMVRQVISSRRVMVTALVFALVFIYGMSINLNNAKAGDYKGFFKIYGYVTGVNPQFYDFINEDFSEELRISKEIGDIVQHNTNTLILADDYGRSLTYHGELSGLPWPITTSFEARRDRGIRVLEKDELYNSRYFTIRSHARFIQYTPDYFIITAFDEFDKQPDLKKHLNLNYPVLAKSDDYIIFDLKRMRLLNEEANQ